MKLLLALMALAAAGTPGGHAGANAMEEAALALVASLPPELASQAKQPFDSDLRKSWAFTPVRRVGVAWREMSPESRRRAETLLKASLSATGVRKAEGVRTLEAVLRELEGAHRDPDAYVFTIYGEPGPQGRWAWRYEGHHLSLNFTIRDGVVVASTPQFFGANPAEVRDGTHQGLRVLAEEEEAARALLASLNSDQKKKAVLGERAPSDILSSNLRKAASLGDAGIAYGELTEGQRKLLWALVQAHASAQAPTQEKARLERVRAGGLDSIRFAWIGALEKGQGHYYRVQGKTFLIEYDNTQNRANHIHTVWRDFDGDFGGDALEEHYRTSPHHRKR